MFLATTLREGWLLSEARYYVRRAAISNTTKRPIMRGHGSDRSSLACKGNTDPGTASTGCSQFEVPLANFIARMEYDATRLLFSQ